MHWVMEVVTGGASALMGALAVWGPGYAAKRRISRSAHTREPTVLVARGLIELGLKPHQVQAVMRQYRDGALSFSHTCDCGGAYCPDRTD